jgi:hypothetical protein
MNKQIKNILLIFFFCILSVPVVAEEPDFNNLETVLKTFADSRKTRDLKEHGVVENKEAFSKTLENQVYKPVDDAVIKHLEQMPEYAGKRILTHDFRTPGNDGASVNTDRDVRVLVEVEMDRWIEVPVNKWENVYYKEFAQKTGMKVDDSTPFDAIKKHASKYRQLPTDRFHMEAGADYSDVGSIKVFEVNGRTKVISTPNVVRAKKGFSRLKDPEGLAKMYLEKADEQYRQAKDIERQMKDSGLSNEEVKVLHDKLEMHEIEGTVQLKKGVETLEALREGYKKQGYDVGKLPDTFKKAVKEIKKVDGTSQTDIKKLKADISALEPDFIKDLGELNRKVSSQIESLKIAKKKTSSFRTPDISLANAGKAAGIAGDILSIKDALDRADQGNHLFINFDKEDSKNEKALKTVALAAIELAPIPVIDAMERGWQVDEEEKEYLKVMMAHGEEDWKTHPVTSMVRVSTKIIYRTVTSMTLDPIISGKTAVEEGTAAVKDISNNFIADFTRQKSAELQKLKFDAFVERSEKFKLSGLDLFVNHGLYFGHVIPGDRLEFFSNKNDTWTSDYILRWELVTPEGKAIKIKESPASEENAGNLDFIVPELSFGEYKVMLRSFELASGLQAGFTERRFKMNAKTDLGKITAAVGGKHVNGDVTSGDAVSFHAAKLGEWNSMYEVEWMVDGERYQKGAAPKEGSNRFTLQTGDLKPGIHSVAVRMLMTTPFDTSIAAHQAYRLKVKAKKVAAAPEKDKTADLSDVIAPGESHDVHQRGKDRWRETVKQFIAQIPPCLQGEFSNWAWKELIKLGDDRARQEYIGNLTLSQVKTDRAGVFAHTGGFWADDMAKKPFNQCSAKWIENMRDAGFITYSKAWNALNSMWKNAKYDGIYPGPRSEAEARARKQAWQQQIADGLLQEVPVTSQPAVSQRPQRPQRPGSDLPGKGSGVNSAELGRARAKEIVAAIMHDIPPCMGNRSNIRRRFETDINSQINALGRQTAAEFKSTKVRVLTGAAKNNLNMLKEGGLNSCEREWLSNYQRSGLLSSGEINKAVQEEARYYVVFTLEGDKGRDWVTPTSWDVVDHKPRTGLFDRFPKKYATKGYAYKRWVVAVGPLSRKKAETYCEKARQGKVVITANYTPWVPVGSGSGYEMDDGEYITKSIGVAGGF